MVVVMPILCSGAWRTTGALQGRNWAHEADRHAAVFASPATHPCGPDGRQRIAGGEQPRLGQIRHGLAYCTPQTGRVALGNLASYVQQSPGSGKDGKRYLLHQPDS